MTNEILREVTTIESIEEATSECVLGWACRVEAQSAQRSTLNNTQEDRDFDTILHNTQKWMHGTQHGDSYEYCRTGNMLQLHPAYRKK